MTLKRTLLLLLTLLAATGAVAQDCHLGNLDPVVTWEAGWVQAGDRFAQFAPPELSTCNCDIGIEISEVHCQLVVNEPTTLTARALVMSAAAPGGCAQPDIVELTSDPVTVDLDPGLQTVVVPWDFDCFTVQEDFFVVFEITALTGGVEIPVTGHDTGIDLKRLPGTECNLYRHDGSGWQDMVAAGFPGGAPIRAVASCCGQPIGDDDEDWSSLKKSFR